MQQSQIQSRRTVKEAFSLEGIEFHTGEQSSLTIHPAESSSGILFRYGESIAEANIKNLATMHRSTTSIQVGSRVIGTTEHMLAALFGLGITDIIVEIEKGSEIPILDGSAKPWVEEIQKVGVKEIEGYKNITKLLRPLKFASGVSEYILSPNDYFEVDVEIDFPKTVIGNQSARYKTGDSFTDSVSWARSFIGDAAHGEKLDREKILARLKSVDIDRPETSPCILYEGNHYITPLRQDNEPATHKLLDFIGDFSLIGSEVTARIELKKPTHNANHLLVKELLDRNLIEPMF